MRAARFLIPVLLVVSVAAWVVATPRRGKPIHGPCLTHDDCHASERCVVPPSNDGFATQGACVDPCESDLQCPAQFRCEVFADVGRYWSSDRSKSAAAGGGCVAGLRRDADGG